MSKKMKMSDAEIDKNTCSYCGEIFPQKDIVYPVEGDDGFATPNDKIPLCKTCLPKRWDKHLACCEVCDYEFLWMDKTKPRICDDCEEDELECQDCGTTDGVESVTMPYGPYDEPIKAQLCKNCLYVDLRGAISVMDASIPDIATYLKSCKGVSFDYLSPWLCDKYYHCAHFANVNPRFKKLDNYAIYINRLSFEKIFSEDGICQSDLDCAYITSIILNSIKDKINGLYLLQGSMTIPYTAYLMNMVLSFDLRISDKTKNIQQIYCEIDNIEENINIA